MENETPVHVAECDNEARKLLGNYPGPFTGVIVSKSHGYTDVYRVRDQVSGKIWYVHERLISPLAPFGPQDVGELL